MVNRFVQDLTWFAGIRQAVQRHRPKMVFLTSPNNPDGSVISEEDLQAILDLPVLVVLDEAYVDFSDEPSRLQHVLTTPNLVVLRTFSKSAGLAGTGMCWHACMWSVMQLCTRGTKFLLDVN